MTSRSPATTSSARCATASAAPPDRRRNGFGPAADRVFGHSTWPMTVAVGAITVGAAAGPGSRGTARLPPWAAPVTEQVGRAGRPDWVGRSMSADGPLSIVGIGLTQLAPDLLARRDTELAENPAQMELDGRGGDEQLGGDLRVGQPRRGQHRHMTFLRGEI
jgi:hypothetical protein